MAKFAVLLLAAGQSSRFGGKEKKPYVDLDGQAVWLRSLHLFDQRDDVGMIIIAIDQADEETFERRYRANLAFVTNAKVVFGGAQRSDSVRAALTAVPADCDYVAVHDTARPCLTKEMVDKVFSAAIKSGAATLACRVHDTIKRSDDVGKVVETVDRKNLWAIQTPQVFRKDLLTKAHAKGIHQAHVTDDTQLVEAIGQEVAIVEGDATNVKITTQADIALAAAIIKSRPENKGRKPIHPFQDENQW